MLHRNLLRLTRFKVRLLNNFQSLMPWLLVHLLGIQVSHNIIIITFYVCQCSISSLSHESTFCRPFCSSAGADMERSGTGWDEIYYSEMQVRLQNLY